MNKTVLSIVGMVVSLVMILCGILVMTGAFGGDTSYASSSYLYDSGYASFGADFYTYVSNNAAEAASAARTTSHNLQAIADLLKNVCGLFLMGFGAMGFCCFGMVNSGCKAEKAMPAPVEEETVVEASAEEEAVVEEAPAEEENTEEV